MSEDILYVLCAFLLGVLVGVLLVINGKGEKAE